MVLLVCRYTTFYLTRGSLTYSAPSMVADPQLGFTLAHIGTMTSIFPMAYGVSKFAAGGYSALHRWCCSCGQPGAVGVGGLLQ